MFAQPCHPTGKKKTTSPNLAARCFHRRSICLAPAVFQNPAPPLKVLHTAPEVEAKPQPKKLCAPPPDPGCNVDEAKASSGSYYCGFCDKNCDHNTANCPFYDSDPKG
ncbi:hypothetical protein ACLB2K_047336 [Fragaria x ananassa]